MMAWHQNALKGILGDDVALHDDEIQCGWFRCRLVKGGPFVPARIWLQQDIDPETGELIDDERLCCDVNGRMVDAQEYWSRLCKNPIPQHEWQYLSAKGAWTTDFSPDEPAANPAQAVDWTKIPTTDIWKG